MRLPNGDRAVVSLEKRLEYCLNPHHPRGQHKARVFQSALGITAAEAERLQAELLFAAATNEAVEADTDDYGHRFMLDLEMDGPEEKVVVRSLWIVRTGEDFPRLTSCFVN